jgi:PhnB protein
MQVQVQPYLFFEGRCEEAIEFYRKALDAKVDVVMRYKEAPPAPGMKMPPDKVMHAAFKVGETQVLASDGNCSGKPSFQGISLTVSARDDAHAKRVFSALAEGGKVTQPLTKTFFSSNFGMLNDKFGVGWMVVAPQEGGHG